MKRLANAPTGQNDMEGAQHISRVDAIVVGVVAIVVFQAEQEPGCIG